MNQSEQIEKKIMSQIKSGRVKLRSKYLFLAKKLGLNSGLVLTIALSILFFSLALFYLRTTDSLNYLWFGQDGIVAFLESFPYMLVAGLILFLFAAGYLISRTEWSYHRPFKYIFLALLLVVLATGSLAAYSGISENIENQVFEKRGPGMLFNPFISPGIKPRSSGIAGRVYYIEEDYIILETPRGLEKVIFMPHDPKINIQDLNMGEFIIAIGSRNPYNFQAKNIKLIEQHQFPAMIKRGIHRQLHPWDPNNTSSSTLFAPEWLNFDPITNKCIRDCHIDQTPPRECFKHCLK